MTAIARPSIQERRQRSERVANVRVQSAGIGVHRTQLGVGQRTEKRQQSADEPHGKRDLEASARLAEHHGGHEKDSRADDRAQREQYEIFEAERAAECAGHATATADDVARSTSTRVVSDSMRSTSTSTPIPGRSRGTPTIPAASIVHSGETMSRAQ